jgi:hypothetical protein
MTDTLAPTPAPRAASSLVALAPVLFGAAVFTSAALVFLVEPMMAKLVLPTMGGSPMVWNTCMAFFQAALLAGYAYAHLLQRVKSLKVQTAIHAGVLVLAALVLPLEVSDVLGDPTRMHPALWMLGVLALSLGPPFAALSATAPLAQAWYARVRAGHADAANPYVLYAASNLGSLLALLAYPTIVEPLLRLSNQTMSWSVGYGLFVAMMLLVALISTRAGAATPTGQVQAPAGARAVSWRDRLIWIGLAAAPSSMMLGVTTFITTDIASAPFLWVAPLALYLLTFILAFSSRQILPQPYVLIFQAAALAALAASLNMPLVGGLPPQIALHLVGFFITALMCHQELAARRPHPSHLTEFYLMLSLGGVIGGAFNAFVAPLAFPGVWEYPLVIVLVCLARPWGEGRLQRWETALFVGGLVASAAALALAYGITNGVVKFPEQLSILNVQGPKLVFGLTVVAAFLLRDRAWLFMVLIAAAVLTPYYFFPHDNILSRQRSFFGVLEITRGYIPGYADNVRILAHGTTLHGAQAVNSQYTCKPLVYYAPDTPIGQVFLAQGALKRNMAVGAVGMGTGSIAAYNRPDDEFKFYEIDQLVVKTSTNPANFSYINGCAKGKVKIELGDARLTLRREKPNVMDVLLVDAFSSDSVPAHLLTVEAMKEYLERIRPDGIVIMHLSNRHLDLMRPVAAVAKAAGGYPLQQRFKSDPMTPDLVDSSEDVIIVAKTPQALAPYVNDPSQRWKPAEDGGVKPWTDDYTNLFSAMMRQLRRQ